MRKEEHTIFFRAQKKPPQQEMHRAAEDGVIVKAGGFDYLEQTIKRMVEELKQQDLLSKDFTFLTNAEQEAALEHYIDQFIKNH